MCRHLALMAAMAVIVDRLIYAAPLGISLTIAFAALATAALLANASGKSAWRTSPFMLLLLTALGTAIFALALSGGLSGDFVQRLSTIVALLVIGPFRLLPDLLRLKRAAARTNPWKRRHGWSVWAMPTALGAVFVGLFASANPLIELWFSKVDLEQILVGIDMPRIGFWLLAASLVWPFIHVRAKPFAALGLFPARQKTEPPGEDPQDMFGPAAILRALIVFNVLFAVQTVLDVAYLWGGAELPDGMTYAQYAHRGAYPLIVTALLAATFVLAAMRPGSPSERIPTIRALVYLWTGQNVMLVISAMLRLDLYVAIYSLTMLRVAAFLWMLLVATGLVLIVARIALDRSNGWLVSMNAMALATLLYVCCFVNFPYLIASYNVAHCREVSGTGTPLDVYYLLKLGPHAIPALDPFLAAHPDALYRRHSEHSVPVRVHLYNGLLQLHRKRMSDWRGWTFRDWRLMRDLDGRAELPVNRSGTAPHSTPPALVLDPDRSSPTGNLPPNL
jgi:hypothetical protein